MGILARTEQHRMESCWQNRMMLDEFTQPGWGDAVDYIGARDIQNGNAELQVPAVVTPQIDMTAATQSLTLYGEHVQTLDIVQERSQMPAVTSRP